MQLVKKYQWQLYDYELQWFDEFLIIKYYILEI